MKNNKNLRFKKRSNGGKPSNNRVREHSQKMLDHYTHLARDAAGSDDRVMAEYYWQHVDHYKRVLQEFAPQPSSHEVENPNNQPATEAQVIEIEQLPPLQELSNTGIVEIAFEESKDEAPVP